MLVGVIVVIAGAITSHLTGQAITDNKSILIKSGQKKDFVLNNELHTIEVLKISDKKISLVLDRELIELLKEQIYSTNGLEISIKRIYYVEKYDHGQVWLKISKSIEK